jgi:spermidine synthase
MTAMAHSGANSGAQPGSRPARAVIRAEVGHGSAELVGDPDRPHGWTLLVDGTAQSHVDLDDPVHLEFEYIRRIGHLIDLCAPAYAPLRAVHLGGGAWTLARYVAATRPGSTQTVVELDGPLAEFVGHRLPADGLGIEVTVGDARAALAATAPASVDLVVLDVFAGARTPAHLTSAQFAALVARTLAPGGAYAANVADGGPALAFAGSQVAAARAAFRHVAVLAPPDVLRGRRFGNLVLVASAAPLPVDDLRRHTASDPFPARVLAGADLDRFTAEARTDRTAVPSPVPPPGFWGR